MERPKFNHIAIKVRDLETTKEFYQNVLGLKIQEERPGKSIMFKDDYGGIIGCILSKEFSVDGIDHFGFTFLDFESFEKYKEELKKELNKRGIPYEEKEHHDGTKSLFFNEINGYKLQIVYLPKDYFKR
jgi:catechol 2,3-dioxygenase-like lactoylglutathione lyase family enzyme